MLRIIVSIFRSILIGFSVFLMLVIVGYILQIGGIVRPFEWEETHPNHDQNAFSVMTGNVGNSDLRCFKSRWKLCLIDVEQRLATNLQMVKPDIIALQEVFPVWQCDDTKTYEAWHVCSLPQDPPQARRLLGNEYSIACDPNGQFECIGVHEDAGEILGCPVGELCYNARSAPVPSGCDIGFSISAITVRLVNGAVFDVVNVHPASVSEPCRAGLLQRALIGDETSPSIIEQPKVLIMGDFNTDPWRDQDTSTAVWNGFVEDGWAGVPLTYHSGTAEVTPPFYTLYFVVRRTLDLCISNFAEGVCHVFGVSPGTMRLDGGVGNDHRAVYGILTIRP